MSKSVMADAIQEAIDQMDVEKKNRKRQGFFKVHEMELSTKVGLEVWAYGKDEDFVGRLEINRAGIKAFVGPKGRKSIADLSWEKVFKRLANEEEE